MFKNKLLFSAGLFVLALAFVVGSAPSKVFAIGSITSIAPNFGIVNGGTAVTITGSGTTFTSGALTVTIGGVSATSIVAVSATSITAVTGAHAAGVVNVVVSDTTDGANTLTGGFTYIAAPTAISLGGAASYAVLAETTVTTTGVTSIVGNVAVSPAAASFLTGFGQTMDSSNQFSTSPLVVGNLYAADYTSPTPATLTTAVTNMGTAYTAANAAATTVLNAGAGHLAGLTLAPGVYTFGTNVDITNDLTLNGSSSDVWIFQITGNLNISSAKSVLLTGGAVASNVFWAVSGTTTLQTTSTFKGTILAGPGASTIAMLAGSTLTGKALGQTAVTLSGASIADSAAAPVTVTKTAAAIAHTSTITYTLTTGTFSGVGGIVNGNWTLGGADSGDLGSVSSVALSSGNKVATVTVSGTVVIAHTYTIAPAQAAFAAGFTAPAAAAVTVNAHIISTTSITGVVSPVVGATPVTSAISGTGYTGTVSWSPNDAIFGFATPYTATITLTPTDAGYTLTGVNTNQFLIIGARTTNSANSGVITAAFTTNMIQGGGGGQLKNGVPTTTTTTSSNGTTTTTTTTTPGITIVAVTPPVVTPTAVTVAGCDNRTSGFSTANGQSCSGSTTTVTTTIPVMISGCNSGTTGFSTVNGVSCANNGTSVTTSTTYNLGSTTLRNGSKGESVKQLQKLLNRILNMTLKEDGVLGPKTIAVIKQWQKDHGLVADGLVGAKTKAAMEAEAK